MGWQTLIAAGLIMAIPDPNFQSPTIPVHRLGEEWWKQRHESCSALTRAGGVDVAFVGDSITQGWESNGRTSWDVHFAPMRAANFGFSGDRTENVLWRLENGELVGLRPKVVVLMIGTNNIGHQSATPAQTAEGVRAIVAKLRAAMPDARILLHGILPRGRTADDPLRKQVAEATAAFRSAADGDRVLFYDPGPHFIRADGSLRDTLMPDLLHLSPDGYAVWAKALAPRVRELLEARPPAPTEPNPSQ